MDIWISPFPCYLARFGKKYFSGKKGKKRREGVWRTLRRDGTGRVPPGEDPPVFLFRRRKRPDVFQPFRKNPAAGKPARLAAIGRLPGPFRLPAGNIRFLRRSLPVEKGISRSGLFRPSECGVLPLA